MAKATNPAPAPNTTQDFSTSIYTDYERGNYRMKIAEIAEKGNDLETLKALRHKIADAIDQSNSGRDIAALSRQLQIVMEQISVLDKSENNEIDELLANWKDSVIVRDSKGKSNYDKMDKGLQEE